MPNGTEAAVHAMADASVTTTRHTGPVRHSSAGGINLQAQRRRALRLDEAGSRSHRRRPSAFPHRRADAMGLQILGAGDGRLITHPSSEPIVCEALRQRLAAPCHKRLQAVPPFQQLWEEERRSRKAGLVRMIRKISTEADRLSAYRKHAAIRVGDARRCAAIPG